MSESIQTLKDIDREIQQLRLRLTMTVNEIRALARQARQYRREISDLERVRDRE